MINDAIDLLEDLNGPAYKIVSFEAADLSLIKYVASTGRLMITSTGMADAEEIKEALAIAREGSCEELAILHYVSGYPAPAEDYNLRTIPDLIERLGLVTVLSDHTLNNTTAITSVAMYGRKSSGQGNVKFRRSLYFVKDMEAGEAILRDSILSVRPRFGLPPKHFDAVLGKLINRDVSAATPIS